MCCKISVSRRVRAWDVADRSRSGAMHQVSAISDSLIAVTKFGPVPENAPVATVLIGTYCVAQILLMLGVMTATSPQALSQPDQPVAQTPTP